MSIKDERVESILIHLAADFIAREAGRETLITPTRAELGTDHKSATVYISVFPDTQIEHALHFLERNADEFRAYMKKEARFSHLPRVRFMADRGEQHRQHLDEVFRSIPPSEN